MYFGIVLALVFAALGAWLGWNRGTRRMHRVSSTEPHIPALGRHEVRRKKRRVRLLLTLGWLLAGAFVGLAAGLAIGWR